MITHLTTLQTLLNSPPRLKLTFYDFGILLTKPCEGGQTEYLVDPTQVATTLGPALRFETGILPPDILSMGQVGTQRWCVGYRKAQRTSLFLDSTDTVVHIPLPGLVYYRAEGQASHDHLFAVKGRPTSGAAPLWQAPIPNIYPDGRICWGNVSPHTDIWPDWSALLGSVFTQHSVSRKSQAFPEDIRQQWLALAERGSRVYPLRDLIPIRWTLNDLLKENP